MTVSANDGTKSYVGNGVTRVYDGPKLFRASDVSVIVTVAGVQTTPGFSVSGIGADQSVITMTTAPPNLSTVTIQRNMPIEQQTDYTNQQQLQRSVVENSFDAVTMMMQDLAAKVVPATLISAMIESYAALPADATVRGDLASASIGKGSDMVVVRDTGNHFSGSTLEAVLAELYGVAIDRPEVYLETYGAVGDGIADDSAALQAALDAGVGKTVRLRPGKTYLVAAGSLISSNTTVIAYGATVRRSNTANRILTNNADGVTGSYNANAGISIYGGTWDMNYPAATSACVGFAFHHCSRIKVKDTYMLNPSLNHCIEINSSSDVLIEGNRFLGGAEQTDETMEAVQIDGAISSATLFGGAPYDNTFCTNVRVIGNSFINCGTGVGSHSAVTGQRHYGIEVIGNYFSSPYMCGVRALNWADSKICDNTFYQGFHGIRAGAGAGNVVAGLVITGNTFRSIGGGTTDGTAGNAHAIWMYGLDASGTEQIVDWVIADNVFWDTNQTKSGNAIQVEYCPNGSITGNSIVGVTNTGIRVFGNGGITINGNRASSCGAFGIDVGSCSTVNIQNNVCDTINYSNLLKGIVSGNNVFNASGITSSGTNTNTTKVNNLQGTVFA